MVTFWLRFDYVLVTLWSRSVPFVLPFGYAVVTFCLFGARFGYIAVAFWLRWVHGWLHAGLALVIVFGACSRCIGSLAIFCFRSGCVSVTLWLHCVCVMVVF